MQTPPAMEPNVAQAKTIFARVFVPIDYTMASHRALGVALELQRTLGSAVCVYHDSESSTHDEFLGGLGGAKQGKGEAEGRMHRFLDNVAPGAGRNLEVRTRVGEEIDEGIRREARDWGATLIVLPESQHKGLLRSRAEKIQRELGIPTLLLPAEEP